MNFIEAIKSVYKKTFECSGRASRSEYWYFVLFSFLVGIPLNLLVALNSETVLVINLIYVAAVGLPAISVTSRRFQDAGIPPFVFGLLIILVAITWLAALNVNYSNQLTALNVALIVTGISYITLLAICLKSSDKNENQYGPNPFYTDPADNALNLVNNDSAQSDQKLDDLTGPSERQKAVEKSDKIREKMQSLGSDSPKLSNLTKKEKKVERDGGGLQSLKSSNKEAVEVNSSSTLEMQLTEAKKLFEKELISKEEYDKLRAKILDFG